jgi:DNA-binding MarR family transcriptional regulator
MMDRMTDLMADLEVPDAGWPSPDELGATVWKAQRAVERAVDAWLAPLGMSSGVFRLLRLLHLGPGQSAADLARRLGFAPQSVAAAIERAERARLVERRPHPVHGRVRQLFLTDAGRAAYARAAGVIAALEQGLADDLSPAARRLLRRQLIDVAARAQALTSAGRPATP